MASTAGNQMADVGEKWYDFGASTTVCALVESSPLEVHIHL